MEKELNLCMEQYGHYYRQWLLFAWRYSPKKYILHYFLVYAGAFLAVGFNPVDAFNMNNWHLAGDATEYCLQRYCRMYSAGIRCHDSRYPALDFGCNFEDRNIFLGGRRVHAGCHAGQFVQSLRYAAVRDFFRVNCFGFCYWHILWNLRGHDTDCHCGISSR